MFDLSRDIRSAFRQLRTRPGFSVIVIALLGFGIAASVTVFGFVHAILLQPLPFPNSDRLMWLAQKAPSGSESLSYPNYFDWRSLNKTFSGIACYHDTGVTLGCSGDTLHVAAETVSSNFFDVLGRVTRNWEQLSAR
jgi:hypothetical protein